MPEAKCLEVIEANLFILPRMDLRSAVDAESGLKTVFAGENPLCPEGRSLLTVEPRQVLLSALKPAGEGGCTVL